MMRAWVYHGIEDLRLEELPEPQPGPGEVAVRIAYTGICGSDLHVYHHDPGTVPLAEPHPVTGHHGPVTLGHEASGTVVAVGAGVSGVDAGMRVAIEPIVRRPGDEQAYNLEASFYGLHAPGFLADTAVVQAGAVHPLPDGVSLRDGALAEPLAVTWHAAVRADAGPQDSVLVLGGGPIGIGAALAVRARGAERVVVSEPSSDRRAVLEKLGLTTVDPTAGDGGEAVRELLGGAPTLAMDAAGVAVAVTDALGILAPQGRLMIVATHVAPIPIDGIGLLVGERSIQASMAYFHDFPVVLGELAAGAFPSAEWTDTVPFAHVVDQGIERLLAGRAMKLLVEVGGG